MLILRRGQWKYSNLSGTVLTTMKNPLWISENKQSAPGPLLFAAPLYWEESIFSWWCLLRSIILVSDGQWLVFTYLSGPLWLSGITSRQPTGCRMGGLTLFLTGNIFTARFREREREREIAIWEVRDVLTAVKSCWNLSVRALWEHLLNHLSSLSHSLSFLTSPLQASSKLIKFQ